MKEQINQKYNNLIANSAQFRQFVIDMDKLSTNEIIARYELKTDLICSVGLLGKQA